MPSSFHDIQAILAYSGMTVGTESSYANYRFTLGIVQYIFPYEIRCFCREEGNNKGART